jgi:hypothetical protein
MQRFIHDLLVRTACAGLCMGVGWPAHAQQPRPDTAGPSLSPVTVTATANRDPVEKSYRKMIKAMDLFENQRASLSPAGTLRFKLLPRKRDTDLENVSLYVFGSSAEIPVPVAPDKTFTLPRDQKALDENAQVTPNRKALTMTWRSEVRTPGLPPNTRRLGDLRLECQVGMEAGLVSNTSNFIGRIARSILLDTPSYCERKEPLYLFFADKPIFSVTLIDGVRREVLAIDKLYANAADDRNLRNDLPVCDCEVLLDRTYFLPLGDMSWSHDTLVEFDYMEAP